MTEKEALQAVLDGKRVTKGNWDKGTYMFFDNDNDKLKIKNEYNWNEKWVVSNDIEQDFEIAPEPILDKEEKAYLGAVIKPFRDNVLNIRKMARYISGGITYESIRIETRDGFTTLPSFKKDTMYKGMEKDRKYTLKELEL